MNEVTQSQWWPVCILPSSQTEAPGSNLLDVFVTKFVSKPYARHTAWIALCYIRSLTVVIPTWNWPEASNQKSTRVFGQRTYKPSLQISVLVDNSTISKAISKHLCLDKEGLPAITWSNQGDTLPSSRFNVPLDTFMTMLYCFTPGWQTLWKVTLL